MPPEQAKRPASEGEEGADGQAPGAKRARTDDGSGGGGAAAAAPAAPAAVAAKVESAVEKARRVLEQQRALQERLKARGAAGAGAAAPPAAATTAAPAPAATAASIQAAAAAAAARAAAAAAAARAAAAAKAASAAPAAPAAPPAQPKPSGRARAPILRVDSQGREVDEHGNVIDAAGAGAGAARRPGAAGAAAAAPPFATTAANRRAREEAERAAALKREQAERAERERAEAEARRAEAEARRRDMVFVDPRLSGRGLGRRPLLPPAFGSGGGRGGGGGLLGGGGRGGRGGRGGAMPPPARLEFLEPGSLTRVADEMRVRQQIGGGGRGGGGAGPRGGGGGGGGAANASTYDAAAAAARAAALREAERRSGAIPEERDPLPLLAEWWDRPLLPAAGKAGGSAGGARGGGGGAGGGYDACVPRWRPGTVDGGAGDDESDLVVPVAIAVAEGGGDGAAAAAAAATNGSEGAAAAADASNAGAAPTTKQQPPPSATTPFRLVTVHPPSTLQNLREARITAYVEHPVPEPPPAEAPPPPPPPLRLTAKELRKLRTLRRQAREEERQALIRQGLLEPPPPKVRIANLMRVLGAESAADPTAIEREVRRQMAERRAAHDDRNAARMLTPAERRAKKVAKMFDDVAAAGLMTNAGGGGGGGSGDEAEEGAGAATGVAGPGAGAAALTTVSVYRVEDLSHGQHRFKVDVNARENRMSGIALVLPPAHRAPLFLATGGASGADRRFFSLVVVEGCPKSTKRYAKLMLRRIDWNDRPPPKGLEWGCGEEEGHGDGGQQPENACHLVWQGQVAAPAFSDFSRRVVPDPASARRLLEAAGVAHYWDAASGFDIHSAAAAAAAAPPV